MTRVCHVLLRHEQGVGRAATGCAQRTGKVAATLTSTLKRRGAWSRVPDPRRVTFLEWSAGHHAPLPGKDVSYFGAHGHVPLGVALLLAAVAGSARPPASTAGPTTGL
ncbi:hypothetical protein [Streptomyces sp. NPDC048516]|uniref:hypothetical protein n=1 Tax=Streptomyces sp. NPDC048516 TaxID=3365565 RepID=UPI00371CA064